MRVQAMVQGIYLGNQDFVERMQALIDLESKGLATIFSKSEPSMKKATLTPFLS